MRPNDINFLIIGAAKSATTWLQKQLQKDPFVYMPDPELHFFSREYNHGMEFYLSQFSPPSPDVLIGEKSNSYLDDPAAAERIHATLPDVKLICQLRNPVERAYSDYCMLYRRGDVDGDIEAWLDPRTTEANRFLIGGNYAQHLSRYIDLFGRERLLILIFEDLETDPDQHFAKVQAYLGLNFAPVAGGAKIKDRNNALLPEPLRRHLRWLKPWIRPLRGRPSFEAVRSILAREPDYPPISADLRARLEEYYARSTADLEQLLGRTLPQWRFENPSEPDDSQEA